MKPLLLLLICAFMAIPSIANAQLNNNSSSTSPIEISAEDSLQWLQNQKQYVANGSVIVTQDDMSLKSEKLVANYDDNNGDSTNITNLVATGNVILKDSANTVKGDKIMYDLITEDVIVTGGNLSIVTTEQTITASEKLTYNAKKGVAEAIGNAKIETPKETLTAKKITAKLSTKPEEQKLISAQADGGVTIKTRDETITGNSGFYDAKNQTATINGNVKIIRGENSLEGNRAKVNLNTNVSQIFGDEKNGKRVKGVFFPSSK